MLISKVICKVCRTALPAHPPGPLGIAFELSHSWRAVPKLQALEMTDETTSLSACSKCSKVQTIQA